MKARFIILIIISFRLNAQCAVEECGPPPMMPNYTCSDGVTIAGPGDCIQNGDGQCYWEIIYCPSSFYIGYLRSTDASFCMDDCSYYYLETESGEYLSNVMINNIESLSYFTNRYVYLDGEEVWCVECGAVDIGEIHISNECNNPVDCFQDPCLVESCTAHPNAECVPNYCGGCYADFYNTNGQLITECTVNEDCIDLSDLFFGLCDMILGVGYSNEACQYISGCDWILDGVDYSYAFFESIDECESACYSGYMTCDEIAGTYESLHVGQYATCEFDNDCMAVWGACDVGLGGCHYSVNEENYPEEEINDLVVMWLDEDCMQWVCDCSAMPYAQCTNGTCTSAYCMGDNPAGCSQAGCDDGYECVVDPNQCVPSWCDCDGFYGQWFCTEDCGGGSCMEIILLGDVNNDGQINISDIVLIVGAILNAEYNSMGDINNDDQLNVTDIILLVNLILG